MSRTDVTFRSAGITCAAWHYNPVDHFDVYSDRWSSTIVCDQIESVSRQLHAADHTVQRKAL